MEDMGEMLKRHPNIHSNIQLVGSPLFQTKLRRELRELTVESPMYVLAILIDGSKRIITLISFCVQPRNKNQTITVITFGRAGEDNKSFRLTDIETTVQGFAGADYDLCVYLLENVSVDDD
jgi:hypothetical protein